MQFSSWNWWISDGLRFIIDQNITVSTAMQIRKLDIYDVFVLDIYVEICRLDRRQSTIIKVFRVIYSVFSRGQDHPNFEFGFGFYLRKYRLTVYWWLSEFRWQHLCFSIIHHNFLVLILLTQCWVAFIFQVYFQGLLWRILVNGWITSDWQCLVDEAWLPTHSVTISVYYFKRGHLLNCTDLDIS